MQPSIRTVLALLICLVPFGRLPAQCTPSGSLSFDNTALEVPHTAFYGLGDFTIESWMRIVPGTETINNSLLSLFADPASGGAGVDNHFLFYQNPSGFYQIYSNGTVYGTAYAPPSSEWVLVSFVREGSQFRIYESGVLMASFGVDPGPMLPAPGGAVIGNDQDGLGGPFPVPHESFEGSIDEFRVWDHARTPVEILAFEHQELTGLEPGLRAYWKFNEGTGTTVEDSSPNQYDGTFYDLQPPTWSAETASLACASFEFDRGDANSDGSVNLADAIQAFSYVFDGASIDCEDATDANDDGLLDLADGIMILTYVFGGGPTLPEPFGTCEADPTSDDLSCQFSICP